MIFVIVACLTKMVHYELVKVTINASKLAEIFMDIVLWHHGLLDSIISDQEVIITSKFWFSICYFVGIKKQLFTAFYPQTDGQTE